MKSKNNFGFGAIIVKVLLPRTFFHCNDFLIQNVYEDRGQWRVTETKPLITSL